MTPTRHRHTAVLVAMVCLYILFVRRIFGWVGYVQDGYMSSGYGFSFEVPQTYVPYIVAFLCVYGFITDQKWAWWFAVVATLVEFVWYLGYGSPRLGPSVWGIAAMFKLGFLLLFAALLIAERKRCAPASHTAREALTFIVHLAGQARRSRIALIVLGGIATLFVVSVSNQKSNSDNIHLSGRITPDEAHPLNGLWKLECRDNFGLAIAAAGPAQYSFSFCGPKGCSDPGLRPISRIVDDPMYRIDSTGTVMRVFNNSENAMVYRKCWPERQ